MLGHFKSSRRRLCALATGVLAALLGVSSPTPARLIESSHDKPADARSMPTEPSALLNGLISGERPLSWREPTAAQTSRPNEQIIWPPIDQPLDLRGGYKHAPQKVVQPARKPVDTTPRLSKDDCETAAAFMLAGARARDQGVSAQRFLGQLRADLLKLGAEPPANRWFLHSEIEAQLLLSAATRIYSEPRAATWHFTNFVKRCEALRASR